MATLLKESFVHKVLHSLKSSEIIDLSDLIDNNSEPLSLQLAPDYINSLSAINKGVSFVSLVLDTHYIVKGFLCYSDTECGLFGFSGNQEGMSCVKINPETRTYETIYEGLDIEEFRRIIADKMVMIKNLDAGDVDAKTEAGEGIEKTVANKKLSIKVKSDIINAIRPKKVPSSSITLSGSTVTVSDGTFNIAKKHRIIWRAGGQGGSFIAFPYNTSECLVAGKMKNNANYTAYMNSNGGLTISLIGALPLPGTAVEIWYSTMYEVLPKPKYLVALDSNNTENALQQVLKIMFQLPSSVIATNLNTYLKNNYSDKWIVSGSKVLKDSLFPNSVIIESTTEFTVDYTGFNTREEAEAVALNYTIGREKVKTKVVEL